MSSGQFVGRVGGLAVALGVGAAVFTGSGVAWASEDPASETPSAETSEAPDSQEPAENGIAADDDSKRPSYLVNHIAVVQDMVAHGTDIRGYTYWSFVDNLEWSEGYDLQFGLYESDPDTPELERIPKPASIAALSGITTANGLPVSLLQQYLPG